jgi:hypothetical protein
MASTQQTRVVYDGLSSKSLPPFVRPPSACNNISFPGASLSASVYSDLGLALLYLTMIDKSCKLLQCVYPPL